MSLKESSSHGENPQQVELQAIPFNGFGRDEEDPKSQYHRLEAGSMYVGFTYGSKEGLSVIWSGTVDFTNLETEVSGVYERAYQKPLDFKDKKTRERVGIILMPDDNRNSAITHGLTIPGSEVPDGTEVTRKNRLVRLSEPGIYSEYNSILKYPERVTWMRYDIYGEVSDQSEKFTIHADNSKSSELRDKPEVSVKLPKGVTWSEDLIEWVVDHHVNVQELQGKLNIKAATDTINKLSDNLPE